MGKDDREYWIHLLDKLNSSADVREVLPQILEELCDFFGFGMGFIYETDYQHHLHCTGRYGVYPVEIPDLIAKNSFSKADLEMMTQKKSIDFSNNMPQSELEIKLSEIFKARSMVFVPIFDHQMTLMACVGIVDRRGRTRALEMDIDLSRAVLITIGAYIKMEVYQKKIETTHKALDSVLNHMGVDVYVNDFETHEILYLNRSMAEPYGDVDDIIGTNCWQTLYDDKTEECDFCPRKKLLDAVGKPTKVYGWDYQRPFDGSWFRVLSAAFPWVDGRLAQVISSVDITEHKRNEEIIRKMAEYDTLTGLPNRARLTKDCDVAVSKHFETGEKGYIFFFDLDGFKQVNDVLGHNVGDELLIAVGEYLQANPFTRENSYRYGGDEFVVICQPKDQSTLDQAVTYILQGFLQPWQLKSGSVSCGVSMGISCFPDDSTLVSDLLRMADQAMYQSKKKGAGKVHLYNRGDFIPWHFNIQ